MKKTRIYNNDAIPELKLKAIEHLYFNAFMPILNIAIEVGVNEWKVQNIITKMLRDRMTMV